ncbi:hypothetical protein EDB81DRAFT_439041 [Dactylonectria macrodidyma]|uniref:Uncharacterized protein n=1 Tax=Dactylonectria macrodidyma TaxID=307937 RepID=A0A9P9F500_9HYPO|nr:hypothetical protein EDB81DRAFT_439041 [Dactylonectria macrodidyma]
MGRERYHWLWLWRFLHPGSGDSKKRRLKKEETKKRGDQKEEPKDQNKTRCFPESGGLGAKGWPGTGTGGRFDGVPTNIQLSNAALEWMLN